MTTSIAPSTVRLLLTKLHLPVASLISSGTLPTVPPPPLNAPPNPERRKLPFKRAALNTTGDADRPSRIPSRSKLNCLPDICPEAAATWRGELPMRPFSTGVFRRAAVSTGPDAVFEIIARPIGHTGSRVGPIFKGPVWR